ncbi:hypothetical protein V5O48_018443 [Marasmius crinis-equi]|uniref:Uncharacterized protein n=1 Tax=Marasmius crinis-equi TaxID=585013 RepID=A0ABR3EL53_9AGAR
MEEPEIPEIRRYLDPEVDPRLGGQSWHPHAVPDRVLRKWGRLFDIVLPSSRRSCCFTRGYTQLVERAGSIIQMNEQLDTTSTFDVFLSRQKEEDPSAEESVELLHPLKLRYFSPSELLRLFAFEDTTTEAEEQNGKKKGFRFVWPPDNYKNDLKIPARWAYLIAGLQEGIKGDSWKVTLDEAVNHLYELFPANIDQLPTLSLTQTPSSYMTGSASEQVLLVLDHLDSRRSQL